MTVYYIDNGVADNTGTGLKYTGLTADAGTDATKIVDDGLNGMVIPNGSFVYNTTRSLGAVTTGWVDATDTLTVAIAGQAAGDAYYLITPWKTLANYTTTTGRTAGDIAYIRAGTTETVAVTIAVDEDGTAAAPISIIGTGDGTSNLESALGITAWQDAATNRPIIDFNSGNYRVTWDGDNFWEIKNIDFRQSNGTNLGDIYVIDSIGVTFTNCIFRDSVQSGGYGARVNGYSSARFINCQFTNNDNCNLYISNSGKVQCIGCTFTSGAEAPDYNIYILEGDIYLENCMFNAAGTSDIRYNYFCNVVARNCVWSSPSAVSYAGSNFDAVVYSEDNDGIYGAQTVYRYVGDLTKSTAVTRAGGGDSSAKMICTSNASPTHYPMSLSGYNYIPDFKLWHTTSPSTISVYVRCYSSWATYPTTSETYLQAEFVSSTTDPPTRTIVTSTDVIASTETWVPFKVAVAPERPGFVNLKLFHSAASSSGGILVDIKPIIS